MAETNTKARTEILGARMTPQTARKVRAAAKRRRVSVSALLNEIASQYVS